MAFGDGLPPAEVLGSIAVPYTSATCNCRPVVTPLALPAGGSPGWLGAHQGGQVTVKADCPCCRHLWPSCPGG